MSLISSSAVYGARSTTEPSSFVISTLALCTITTSLSCSSTYWSVTCSIAIASEATTLKSSPIPTKSGDLFFATKIVSAASASNSASAYEPCSKDNVLRKASAVLKPSFTNNSTNCTITSVSVSDFIGIPFKYVFCNR